MTLLLLILFAGECLFLIAWGLRQPGRAYEFPFLAGATFGGFVLPQLVGLTREGSLPPGGLDKALLMSILCAGMCFLGYTWRTRPLKVLRWSFDEHRLTIAGAALSAIGAYFFFLISRLPEELTAVSQWTGLPVAYLFFARLLNYGFAIAILIYARTGSRAALAVVLFDSLFFFDRIVIAARRATAAEFFLGVLCAFWFGRRWALPRWVMVGALAASVLFLYSTGAYRVMMDQKQARGGFLPTLEDIRQIDFLGNFQESLEERPAELRNATFRISAKDRTGNFDWGLSYWNALVFQYVPAQLVGRELKDALLIDLPRDASTVYGYEELTGTTITGMADSFESFWYLGCLIFFVIAFVLRKMFWAGTSGHVIAQLTYMLVITNGLHAITHGTTMFFIPFIHTVVFMFPTLWWARSRKSGRPSPPTPSPSLELERTV